MLREQAVTIISPLVNRFVKSGFRIKVCGSIRRNELEPRDANLLIETGQERLTAFLEQSCRREAANRLNVPHRELTHCCVSLLIDRLPVHILCTRPDEWGAALLYWTGSLTFTTAIRREAKSQGFVLNRHGLFFNGDLIAGKTERQIFFALGIDYMTPEERN